MNLELKHLTPYFNHRLEVISNERYENEKALLTQINLGVDEDLLMLQSDTEEFDFFEDKLIKIKPIFKPLSDYLEEDSDAINNLGCDLSDQWMISELANKRTSLNNLNYSTILVMLENHIDMFDLIPKGLAIDINDVYSS